MGGFSNIKSKLLAEQVQEQIYHYILETPLEPGSKLPNEFELGEKFGVGRSKMCIRDRCKGGLTSELDARLYTCFLAVLNCSIYYTSGKNNL